VKPAWSLPSGRVDLGPVELDGDAHARGDAVDGEVALELVLAGRLP
jgi:hypothetical protein